MVMKKSDKKRLEKKKPYASLASNLIWSLKRQIKVCPVALFLMLLSTPVHVFLQYAGIYLPALAVAQVLEGHSIAHAAGRIGLLLFFMLLGELLLKVESRIAHSRLNNLCYHTAYELNRKAMSLHYQINEKKEMRDLFTRAVKSTQMWDGVQPLTDLPRQAWAMAESVLCYLLFGAVISFVSPWFVLILTGTPIFHYLSIRAYRHWEYGHRKHWTDVDAKLYYVRSKPGDFAAGKDIRIYSMAGWLTQAYRQLTRERSFWDRQLAWKRFLSHLPELLVILLRDGVVYALLIGMTLRGEISIDRFVLYFAAIAAFAEFVGKLIDNWNALHATSLKLCDLREYLEYPDADGTGKAEIEPHLHRAPEITLRGVCFRYDGAQEDALHEINLTIHPGEKVALVGLNGAGKTTLVKLLCGLYQPTSGEMCINGVSMRDFKRADIYRIFSPVFQEIRTTFFSLAEMVSGTAEEKTDLARAADCMIKAGLGEKLQSLPHGVRTRLDKQVNKDGTELSGGEAQKLMLARALYKDAPMLVLDEPTSALDPLAEHAIYRQYDAMTQGKTALFISHRLASTRFCDRILYLHHGEITEEGTHETLLEKGGAYAALFRLQSCWYREDVKA